MVLSELTNKELKGILRENDARNYSKLNKKGLLKKVNQLIKEQNGGKSKKKYRLRGGSPLKKGNQGDTTPARTGINYGIPESTNAVNYDILNNTKEKAPLATANANAPTAPGTPATTTDVEELSTINSGKRETPIASEASAPPLENPNPSDALKKPPPEKLKYMKNESINPINTVQVPNPYRNTKNNSTRISTSNNNNNKNKPKDECGSCSIL